ncbi:PAN/Apple domain-containing protein [Rhizobium beringeri]
MSVRSFFAFATIAFSTIAISFPAAAADTKRDIQTIKDADFFGFDLRTEQNVSLDQCKTSCIGDKSCKAFTYNPKVKWCFLKSDFKTMNAFPGAIAGKDRRNGRPAGARYRRCAAPDLSHERSHPAGPRLQG